jgi:CBS-domain-containing membrane protein
LATMPKTAADIMNTDVPSLGPQDDARRAIELLAKQDLGALPVVNSEERVIGIVSESDLVISEEQADLHLPSFVNFLGANIFTESVKGFEKRLNKAFATNVRDLMSEDPVVARTDDPVEKVARLIAEKHHNHVPVVDSDGRLAGMVTRADALAALVDEG